VRKGAIYQVKTCTNCHKEYRPTSSAQKYCPSCAPVMRKEYCHKYEHDYHLIHIEKERERSRLYYRAHIEERKKQGKEYRIAHREEIRFRNRAYMHKREHTPEGKLVWQKAKLKRYHELRAGGKLDVDGFLLKCAQLDWCCQLCGDKLTRDTVRIDHIVPVCGGGTNDASNLQPLCQECNGKKGGRLMEDVVREVSP
jgi:5-methylcytosine-specific restriction endonuclease McrA